MSDSVQPVALTCPYCTQERILPVEPLFALADAMVALMVPTRGAMQTALWRHKPGSRLPAMPTIVVVGGIGC